jgi:ribulose-phosphate 3-epimerase
MRQAETFTDYVQIDIMDGKFVPSHSITWEQMAGVKTRLKWEAHLMVEYPEKELEHFKLAGAQKAIFHYESVDSPNQVISQARGLGIEIGLAVNPETPVSRIKHLTGDVDSVLFLSVNPGFYGAKFIPEVLDKIKELRRASPNLEIGIDGGIKGGNIAQIAASGVNVICVGSAVFMQPQPGDAYRNLVKVANGR